MLRSESSQRSRWRLGRTVQRTDTWTTNVSTKWWRGCGETQNTCDGGGEQGRGVVCRGHVSTQGSLWAQRQWPISEHWLVVPAGLVTGSKGWPAKWSVVTKTSSCCAVFTDVTSLPCVTPRSSCAGPRGKPGNIGPPCALSHGPGRDWVPLPGYSANPRERHREDGGCPQRLLWGSENAAEKRVSFCSEFSADQ